MGYYAQNLAPSYELQHRAAPRRLPSGDCEQPAHYERLALTVSEAAQAVGVSRPTVYRWTHLQGFPVVRVGGVTRIPVRAFESWLESQIEGVEDRV